MMKFLYSMQVLAGVCASMTACASDSEKFFEAINSSDTATVRGMLQADALQANARDQSQTPALIRAARKEGNLKVMRELLQASADINATDAIAETALMVSCRYTNAAMAKLLIEHGASLKTRDKEGHTPLIEAALLNSQEVVRFLLDQKVDPNEQAGASGKQTPLAAACAAGNPENVKALLNAGARPDTEAGDATTMPLHAAACMLIHKQKERQASMWRFKCGTEDDYVQVVRLLVENGANITNRTKRGQTALAMAVVGGNTNIVNLLLDHGLDVNDRELDGYTALHRAAQLGPLAIVKILLDHGAKPDVTRNVGDAPLHDAVICGQHEIIRELVRRGANPDIKDDTGATPLMFAAFARDPRLMNDTQGRKTERSPRLQLGSSNNLLSAKALLDGGADPNLTLPTRGNSLTIAIESQDAEMAELLHSRGAKLDLSEEGVAAAYRKARENLDFPMLKLIDSISNKQADGGE